MHKNKLPLILKYKALTGADLTKDIPTYKIHMPPQKWLFSEDERAALTEMPPGPAKKAYVKLLNEQHRTKGLKNE